MINVGWDNGAAPGHFGAYEFGSDLVWDVCTERVASMLMA